MFCRDDEKTAFDWCKEGNAEKLEHLFRDDSTVCQLVDDQGMGLLHWACDRGYSDVVQILLSHNVNVNLQVRNRSQTLTLTQVFFC